MTDADGINLFKREGLSIKLIGVDEVTNSRTNSRISQCAEAFQIFCVMPG